MLYSIIRGVIDNNNISKEHKMHFTTGSVHYIFHFFKLDNAFTHPPSLLPASFCHTFLIKEPLNFYDTKRHLANKINRRPFCSSYLKRLFALSSLDRCSSRVLDALRSSVRCNTRQCCQTSTSMSYNIL